jgi:hypothetical protein
MRDVVDYPDNIGGIQPIYERSRAVVQSASFEVRELLSKAL